MSQFRTSQASFRLVGKHGTTATCTPADARNDVASENCSAAQLELAMSDPRWTLARLAYAQLQEGPLTPEQRDRLVRRAGSMGLRAFDASLIIAIAQDHTRTGRALDDAEPTLRLVRPPHQDDYAISLRRWCLAGALATLLSVAFFTLL